MQICDLLRHPPEKSSSLVSYLHSLHHTAPEMAFPALLLSRNHSRTSCCEALKYNQTLCMTRLCKSILQKGPINHTIFSHLGIPGYTPFTYTRQTWTGPGLNLKPTGEMLSPTSTDFESPTLTLTTSSRFAITCQVPLSMLSTGLFYPSVSTVINEI